MKRHIIICFLWACCLSLWGQSSGGYGGDYNPDNPGNPSTPSETMKHSFKVTAQKGGSVSYSPNGNEFTAGTYISLNANPYTGYKFKHWISNGNILSTSQWLGYTMPSNDVEIEAVFIYSPDLPANPDVVPLTYKVTAEAFPSRGGSVNYTSGEISVGSYTSISASPSEGYKFKAWEYNGDIVSTSSYYSFVMQSKDMHFIALFEYDPAVPGNPSNNPNDTTMYTLYYVVDGLVYYSEKLPAGATITKILNEPTKKGYIFSGWQNLPSVMPAHDITVHGTFTPEYILYSTCDINLANRYLDCLIHLNSQNISSNISFELTLPTQFKPDWETLKLSSNFEGYELVVSETNIDSVFTFTLKGDSIGIGENALFSFKVYLPINSGNKEYTIKLSKANVVDLYEKETIAVTKEENIYLALLGDVNSDNIVNVTDAIGIINKILQQTPSVFTEGAADVNGDGVINITDSIGVINMILQVESTSKHHALQEESIKEAQ